MDIGKRLVELMREKDISRNALSKKSGVSISNIVKIEKNEGSTTVYTIRRLCDTLGIPLEVFFTTDDQNEKSRYLLALINGIKDKGFSDKIIAEWLITLSETLTEIKDEYTRVIWQGATKEDLADAEEFKEKVKEPDFKGPWDK